MTQWEQFFTAFAVGVIASPFAIVIFFFVFRLIKKYRR